LTEKTPHELSPRGNELTAHTQVIAQAQERKWRNSRV